MDADDPFNSVDDDMGDVFSQIDDMAQRVELLDLDTFKRQQLINWDNDFVRAVEDLDVDKIQALVFRKTEVDALLHPGLKRVLFLLWKKDFSSINTYLNDEMQIHLMTKDHLVTLVFLLFSHHCELETCMHLAKKVDLNITFEENISPMIFAALSGKLDLLAICCQHLDEDVKVKLRGGKCRMEPKDGAKADESTDLDTHVGICKRGRSALIYAAMSSCPRCVFLLLTQGFSPSMADKDGLTPLMCVAQSMTDYACKFLLEFNQGVGLIMAFEDEDKLGDQNGGLDIHEKNKCGVSALMFAAKAGSIPCLRILIEKGAKVNDADLTGTTALMYAVKANKKECVELLLEHGAQINAVDASGNSALMHSTLSLCMECLIVLLEHDADLMLKNKEGFTAFLISAHYGNLEALDRILDKGFDINEIGPEGRTALHFPAKNGHMDCLQFLLRHGADVSVTDNDGNTAQDLANFSEHYECSRVIASKNAPLSIPDTVVAESNQDCVSSFMLMCERGESLAVEEMLNKGTDVNSIDKKGRTALMYAVRGISLDCMDVLLKKGLSVNTQDHDGSTALTRAASLNHTKCVGYLLTHGADAYMSDNVGMTPAMVAAAKDSLESLHLLIRHRPEIMKNTKAGTCLGYATSSGSFRCVKFLLKEGYSVTEKDEAGKTLMMQAAEANNWEIMTALLERGCSVEERFGDNRTTVQHAAVNGCVKGLQFLLMHGADVDARCEDNLTALIFSVLGNNFPCSSLLIQAGADVNAEEVNSSTAIKFAAQMGQVETVKMLLAHPDGVKLIYHGQSSAALNALAGDSAECLYLILERMKRDGIAFQPELVFYAARQSIVECLRVILKYPEYKVTAVDSDGLSVLMHASGGGNYDCMKLLFETNKRLNLSLRDTQGKTAILYACKSGVVKCIKYLWKKGANLDVSDYSGGNALMHAAASGNEKCVEFILKHTRQLNAVDESGFNALVYSLIGKNVNVVKLLLRKGINRDNRDDRGMSGFLYAALRGRRNILECLLDSGCKIEETNDQGQTALIMAAGEGRDECITFLLGRGANQKAVDIDGRTALCNAAENGKEQTLVLLLDAGSEVNHRDGSGHTPLLRTVQDAKLSSVRLLLERGADVDSVNDHMKTALMFACCLDDFENPEQIVELLLSHNASVNAIDSSRKSALNYATFNENSACVQLLVNHGADVSSFDQDGESAFSIAATLDDPSCLKIILNSEYVRTNPALLVEPLLEMSINKATQPCLRAMIKRGFFRWTWMREFYIISASLRNIAKVLVTMNITPNDFEVDGKTISLLQFALMKDDLATVKYLLANLYLTLRDLNHLRDNPDLISSLRQKSATGMELRNLLPGLLSTPSNLQAMCLTVISNSITTRGASCLDRRERVTSLPLPDSIKEYLNFERPISKLCPDHWDLINQRMVDDEPDNDILSMSLKTVVWTHPEVEIQNCDECAIDE